MVEVRLWIPGLHHLDHKNTTKICLNYSVNNSLCREKPSCLHTTPASLVDHPSSATVPQVSLKQISTRPSLTSTVLPFVATSLTSPLLQRTENQENDQVLNHIDPQHMYQAHNTTPIYAITALHPTHWQTLFLCIHQLVPTASLGGAVMILSLAVKKKT